MASNNALNTPLPFSATAGGTGLSNPTIHGILVGEAASPVNPIVLGAGQILIGTTASDPVATTLTGGAGVSINSVSGAITISATGNATWTEVLGTSQAMLANNSYGANNVALVSLSLPASSVFGDVISIVGIGAGGWRITQAAGQQVRIGNVSSTVGAGGSVSSTNQNDSLTMVCIVANTIWSLVGGPQTADFTIV